MRVRGPDGSLYNFPDGTPNEEIESFFNPQADTPSPETAFPILSPLELERQKASAARDIALAPAAAVGKVAEPIFTTASDLASDFLNRVGVPAAPGVPLVHMDSLPATGFAPAGWALRYFRPDIAEQIEKSTGEIASGFTEPGQAALLPLAAGSKALRALYALSAGTQIPESLESLGQSTSLPEAAGRATKTAADLAMTYAMARGFVPKGKRYARSQQEAAEVHGDLRPQPGEGKGEVPAEEGGEGVQPQARGGLGQEAQVLLDQASTANRFLGLGHQFEMLDNFGTTDPNHARLARADYAQVDEGGRFLAPGKIQVSRASMDALFKQASPDAAVKALQATLIEEGIHSLTTPGEAAVYGQTLTAVERAIGRRNYLKGWTAEEAGLTENNLGGELLRQRVQQLMGLDSTEIADLAGKERWSVQSLEFIARLIRRFREMLGTKAASAGKQFAQGILDRAQRNIDTAMQNVEAGPEPAQMPAALRRKDPKAKPAIRFNGKVYPGNVHAFALLDAERDAGGRINPSDFEVGFQGSDGKWLDIDGTPEGEPGYKPFLGSERYSEPASLRTKGEDEGFVPPVVRAAPPGAIRPDQLVPAIRLIGGEVVEGKPGETHPDIIKREGIKAEDIDQRGFSAGEGKFFLDREAAAQGTGVATEREPGRLHSTDLIREGEAADEQHGQDMEFARRVVDMTPEQFHTEGRSFNQINLRLGERASEADIAELESLRDEANAQAERSRNEWAKDPSNPEKQARAVSDMQKPQFFNEALKSADKAKQAPASLRRKDRPYGFWIDPMGKAIDVPESHPEQAGKIFPDLPGWELYDEMKKRGYTRAVFEGDNLRIDIPGTPSTRVLSAARRLSEEHGVRVYGDLPNGKSVILARGPEAFSLRRKPTGEEREFQLLHENWLPTLKPWRQQLLKEEVAKGQGTENIETNLQDSPGMRDVDRAKRYYHLARKLYGRVSEEELQDILKSEARPNLPAGLRRKPAKPEEAQMPYTPERAASAGDAYFTQTSGHSLKDFSKYMGARFGELKPGVLRAEFEESFWRWAEKASGDEIAGALRESGLYKKLRIESPEGEVRKIADPWDMEQKGVPVPSKVRSLQTPDQKLRANALASLADKLLVRAEEGRAFLNRTEVYPYEDLADPRVQTKQPVYHEITEDLQKDPVALGQLLTEDARAYGGEKTQRVVNGQVITVAKKGFPVSASKRLTALQNRATGKVSLVSTYRDGRRGPVVVEPGVPGNKAHSTVEQVLPRYRVIASMLTDEPLKDFRKDFDSLGDYQREFGSAARDTAEHQAEYEPPEASIQAEPYRVRPRDEVTPEEADSIMDQVVGEVGYPKSVEDVLLAWEALKDTPQSRRALTALRKLGREITRKEGELTAEQYLNRLATQIYENHAKARTPEEFRSLTMEQSRPPGGEAARLETAPAALRRKVYSLTDESRRIAGAIAATYKRGDLKREIPAMRDAADNVSHDEAFRAQQHIRGATRKNVAGLKQGNPQVLAAANALIQAGAIEPQYAWTPALRKIQNGYIAKNKATPKAKALMKSTAPGDRAQGKALFARIRKQSISSMIQARELDATPPSYKFNPATISQLADFEARVRRGITAAENMIRTGGWKDKARGAAWKAAAEDLLKELDYAKNHYSDPELVDTATRAKKILDQRYDREADNGYSLKHDPNYIPGRYDAEFFNDDSVLFGKPGPRILGKLWRKPQTFTEAGYYEAIEHGPYIAMSRDIADIVSHRVRQGERAMQYKQWVDSLLVYIDPHTKQPVAMEAKQLPTGGYAPPIKGWELLYPRKGYAPIAVQEGWYKLLKNLTGQSGIHDSSGTRFVLEWGQRLKHTILLGDFFHLARLSYYGLSIMGTKGFSPYKKGITALEFNEADLPEAVRNGVISAAEAKWATDLIPIHVGNRIRFMSRMNILREFEHSGLNVGRIQDAIYKDLVANIPLLGKYNKWLFDRYTRGMMAQAAVMEFERQQKANRGLMPHRIIADISRDLNQYFGSIGRQGIFKNPTLQDISRMAFLAPQWVEGLIDKEMVTGIRALGLPFHAAGLYRNNLTPLGTMGRGIGRGLVAMLALTQVINLITKRQPTWKNEEGHKWDAWIPTRDGKGMWLSPLAVFNELSHDLVRLAHSKPRFIDVVNQIGSNKLSPWGRLGVALYTGLTPQKEYIPSTGGVLKNAALQMLPVPISFSRVGQELGSKVLPGVIPPTQPGAIERQAFATFGLKVEPAVHPALLVTRMAQDFVKKEYGKEATIKIIPTTEPSYVKLRNALRDGDLRGAQRILKVLEKTHSDKDIAKAMKLAARHPFTGSKKYEKEFRASLEGNPQRQQLYDKAVEQREAEYQNFLDWFSVQQ